MSRPFPPPDLAARAPEILVLESGAIVERFFYVVRDPIFFDRSRKGRMNAPDGACGVLYAAQGIRGAFAETFLRTPGRKLLPLDLIREKARARWTERR